MTLERMINEGRAKTYHWVLDGTTLCGKTAIMMRRVQMGQRGDGMPPCLKCAERKERVDSEVRASTSDVHNH